MGDIIKKMKGEKFLGWYVRTCRCRWLPQAAREPPSADQAAGSEVSDRDRARVARGRSAFEPSPPPRPELTLAELCERYGTDYNRPRIKNLALYRTEQKSALKRILPILGTKPVSAVTAHDIRRVRDQPSTRYKPNTVISSLRPPSRPLAGGKREGLIDCPNPCLGVERPRRESLFEFLDKDELSRLVSAAEAKARASNSFRDWLRYVAIAFTVRTGCAKASCSGLRWRDLDVTTRRLDVARSYQHAEVGNDGHLRSVCPASWSRSRGVEENVPRRPMTRVPGDGTLEPADGSQDRHAGTARALGGHRCVRSVASGTRCAIPSRHTS